jgi:hypothetical protein
MKRAMRLSILASIVTVLVGCVAMYASPTSGPAATVEFPNTPFVAVYTDEACSNAQSISDLKEKTVPVAAEKPLFIHMRMSAYGYAIGGRSCEINLVFTPKADQKYRVLWHGSAWTSCSGGIVALNKDGAPAHVETSTKKFTKTHGCMGR